MKPNRFREVQRNNQIPIGHMVMEFCTRGVPHILEAAGVDFAIVDLEYPSFTEADVAAMLGWFKATSTTPFVRIPQIEYHYITHLMTAGAQGIMVPHVETAAETRAIVDAVKYPPLGERAGAIGLANMNYRRLNIHEYMAFSNEDTVIICQIETEKGLENLDEIAATPGVDVLWVGHNDLSQSMGIIGEFQNERFLKALERVVNAGKKYNLGVGAQPRSQEQAQSWLDMGFNILSFANDTVVYMDALTNAVAQLRARTEQSRARS
jgi:2-keto-3-deoxy-L-rhamnonate aldolase RhmA